MLGGEAFRFDFIEQPQVEQSLPLLTDGRQFTLQLLAFVGCSLLRCFRFCTQDTNDPIASLLVVDPHATEERQDLLVEFCLSDPHPRVIGFVVAGAAIVAVLTRTAGRLLVFDFHDDRMPAMAAADHAGTVDRIASVIGFLTEEQLHSLEGIDIDDGRVRAAVPGVTIPQFAHVGTVAENRVQLASREGPLAAAVLDTLIGELLGEAIEGVRVIGVEFERSADRGGLLFIDDNHAPAIGAAIGVAIGSFADKETALHAASQPFADIDALLLGVKRRHVRQIATLHATCRRVFRRLGDIDHRHAVLLHACLSR